MTEEMVQTGLTGAVTTWPALEVPAIVAPAAVPPGWTINKVAALVRDLAMNLYDEATVIKKHGLSEAEFASLRVNDFFKKAIEQATIEWNSPQSTQRRLALESAIAVEDALPTVAARLSKPNEPLSDVVALLKVLSEIAGAIGSKAQTQQQGSGERFKIIINLGSDTVQRAPIVINATPETTENSLSTLVASTE